VPVAIDKAHPVRMTRGPGSASCKLRCSTPTPKKCEIGSSSSEGWLRSIGTPSATPRNLSPRRLTRRRWRMARVNVWRRGGWVRVRVARPNPADTRRGALDVRRRAATAWDQPVESVPVQGAARRAATCFKIMEELISGEVALWRAASTPFAGRGTAGSTGHARN
jgi:hypothetical protein